MNLRQKVGNRTEISLQPLYNSQVRSLCKCGACQCDILFLFYTLVSECTFVCDGNNSKVLERDKGERRDLKCWR